MPPDITHRAHGIRVGGDFTRRYVHVRVVATVGRDRNLKGVYLARDRPEGEPSGVVFRGAYADTDVTVMPRDERHVAGVIAFVRDRQDEDAPLGDNSAGRAGHAPDRRSARPGRWCLPPGAQTSTTAGSYPVASGFPNYSRAAAA